MVAWNPSETNANLTLSNGNLTATATAGNYLNTLGDTSASAGNLYFELQNIVAGNDDTGVGVASVLPTAGNYVGTDTNGIASYFKSGGVYTDGHDVNSSDDTVTGDFAAVAISITNKLIWFYSSATSRWNASATADPATGTGGISISGLASFTLYPAYTTDSTDDSGTLVTTSADFKLGLPTGFVAWGSPSNARVSQIVAQVLRTPVPPSNARISQSVAQSLRSVEAQYSVTDSTIGARTAIFQGVKNLAISPLPYSLTCEDNQNFVQSMFYPTLIRSAFAGPDHVSPIVTGTLTALAPTTYYDFTLTGSGTGTESLAANPVIFGQRVMGADNNGDFFALNNVGSQPYVAATIVPNIPPGTGLIGPVEPRGDCQVVAFNAHSLLGQNLIAGYKNPNSFLSSILNIIGFLANPASALVGTILTDLLQALLGENSTPDINFLACGFGTDWITGPYNGSLAFNIAASLATYEGQTATFPTTTGFKVPYAVLGGDPDLYIGSQRQICCDFTSWNSFQWFANNRAFGPDGGFIFDFNFNTASVVSLDDSSMNSLFQDFANSGGGMIATPQGWIAVLSGAYGLSPESTPILIAPDFSRWWLLNFFPTTESGNTLLTMNEPLVISADANGFYIGTSGNDYQYSGSGGTPVPAVNQSTSPVATGCVNIDCASAGQAFDQSLGESS